MIHTKKALPVAIISFLVVIGFTIPATTYASTGDSFFFPTTQQGPHEQLVVYAFGPSQPPRQNSYPSYQPQNQQYNPYANTYGQQSYNPYTPNYASNNFPQMFQNVYPNFSTFNSKFVNNTYIAPQVMQYASTPNSYSNYSYPQSNYGYQPQQQYQSPSYTSYGGYGGGYAQPTGMTDFFGNHLCNWGSDYQGYPCDRDPHQWVQDTYTGEWY